MDDHCSKRCLDDETTRFIRIKARQIAGRYGFHRDEVEDIQQILTLECLERLQHFDSSHSNEHTFKRFVINRGVATLIRSHRAQRRDYRRCCCSLNERAQSDDPNSPELGETVSDDDYHQRLSGRSLVFEERLQLRRDVARVLAILPPELQRICSLLTALNQISEVARAAGISRATLHRRIRVIRDEFARKGFSHRIDWGLMP